MLRWENVCYPSSYLGKKTNLNYIDARVILPSSKGPCMAYKWIENKDIGKYLYPDGIKKRQYKSNTRVDPLCLAPRMNI